MIPLFQPSVGEEELQNINEIFQTKWIGKGDAVQKFTEYFAMILGEDPALFNTTTSCTEGIFLAPDLFNFQEDNEIIVPSISFVAVANSILSRNIKMVLCDVERDSLNTCADYIERRITKNTKAIFLNHYGGVPCEMEEIVSLCKSKNILLLEDSACAVRSFYKDKACGTFGDYGVWSFDAAKLISTGDGGMIYSAHVENAQRVRKFLYHGLDQDFNSGLKSASMGKKNWWEYNISCYGRRGIMNDISASIGLAQLKKLDKFIERRREIHEIYDRELKKLEWLTIPPSIPDYISSSYYLYWIQTKYRDNLAQYLYKHGIYTNFRYWPLNKVKYYNLSSEDLPNTNYVSETTLNLPLYQNLTDTEVYMIIEKIYDFGKKI